jgi:hypothetical protein
MLHDRIDQLNEALQLIGINSKESLHAMHLAEIEEEALNILDLLAAMGAYARQQNEDGTETALVDLTIALEHLLHHAQALLPSLEQELGIAETEDELANDEAELTLA